jgi:hypothetical protein
MADLQVQAMRLPGDRLAIHLPADRERQVVVVADDAAPTHLVLVDSRLEEPLATVRLPTEHTAVLAGLLTRARFTIREDVDHPPEPTSTPEGVAVEAVQIPGGSPLVVSHPTTPPGTSAPT